ncbi:hypothetical protein RZS08_07145, partial [Arthrospira platensis SPKY1]|nr:hypothetical protein [Arthrospira platensis SPKY1]
GAYQSIDLPTAPAILISPTAAPEFLLSARAEYTTRWQQTVTEDYTVTVVAAHVEHQIGAEIGEEIGCTITAEFDARDWASDPSVEPAVIAPPAGDAFMDWQPAGFAAADRDECLYTLMSRAWVRLWASSRSGRVRFSLPCRPDLWLDTWVAVEMAGVRAAGQLVEVEHVLDLAAGEALSHCVVAVGLPGDQDAAMPAWALPAPPFDGYEPPVAAFSCEIGTFVGGQLTSPPFDEETMIGFSTNELAGLTDQEAEGRNFYPHQFSIRAPDLAAEDRDPRTLESITELSVQIPTDLLEVL